MHQPNSQSVSERANIGRRRFLGVLAAGSMAGVAPRAAAARAADETDQGRRKAGYRESQDVKTFYRVNRYP